MSWNTVEQGVNAQRLGVSPEHERLLLQVRGGLNLSSGFTKSVHVPAKLITTEAWTSDELPHDACLIMKVVSVGSDASYANWLAREDYYVVGRAAGAAFDMTGGLLNIWIVASNMAPPPMAMSVARNADNTVSLKTTTQYDGMDVKTWVNAYLQRK